MMVTQSLIMILSSVGKGKRFAKSRLGLLIIVRYFSKAGMRLAKIAPLV